MNGEEWGDQGHTDHTPPAIVDTLYEIEIAKLAAAPPTLKPAKRDHYRGDCRHHKKYNLQQLKELKFKISCNRNSKGYIWDIVGRRFGRVVCTDLYRAFLHLEEIRIWFFAPWHRRLALLCELLHCTVCPLIPWKDHRNVFALVLHVQNYILR